MEWMREPGLGPFCCVEDGLDVLMALPLRVGLGEEGKKNRQDDRTCLNRKRQVEMSLYVCEHRLLIHSGISLDVTLYQRGQIHSLRAAQKSSVSHKAPETSTKRIWYMCESCKSTQVSNTTKLTTVFLVKWYINKCINTRRKKTTNKTLTNEVHWFSALKCYFIKSTFPLIFLYSSLLSIFTAWVLDRDTWLARLNYHTFPSHEAFLSSLYSRSTAWLTWQSWKASHYLLK